MGATADTVGRDQAEPHPAETGYAAGYAALIPPYVRRR